MFNQIPFSDLPGNSKLLNKFLIDAEWRNSQLGYRLTDLNSDIKARCQILKSQSFNREGLSLVIKNYMSEFGITGKSNVNLEKLKNPDCVCVVAGQQPALFGGPLYNYYKIISAIKIAAEMEAKMGIPFVPIFWNGSNDHDFDESNRFYYLDKQRRMVKSALSGVNSQPLDRLVVGREILNWKSKIENSMCRVDFIEEAWQKFSPMVADTIGSWQSRILNQIFGLQGLLIIEPKILKEISKSALSKMLQNEDQFVTQVKINSKTLKLNQYEVQVDSDVSSRMMLFQNQFGRHRLVKSQNTWKVGEQSWDLQKLILLNDKLDVDLTPDALGRPIWQDMLIPVAAYIAGPGEIAYFHQLKGCYELFGMKMPLILPRESGTIFEKNHIKFMHHFSVSKEQFFELKKWSHVPVDDREIPKEIPDNLMTQWRNKVVKEEELRVFEVFKAKLEKLNQKYYEKLASNRKNKEEIGNKQLQEWKDFITPMNLYQERVYGLFPLVARHGSLVLQFLISEPYQFGKHFLYTMND